LNSAENVLLFLRDMDNSWRILAPSGVSTKLGELQLSINVLGWTTSMAVVALIERSTTLIAMT
jgi:hypothetical protein